MARLTDNLQLQITALQQLSGLLESELHLISSRDAEGLMKVVEQKQSLLDQIQDLDTQIKQDYQQLSAQEQQASDLQAKFEQATTLLKDCQYRTEINQKAVEQGQLRLEHLRKLLLEVRAKENMTYDKSGKAIGKVGGKSVSA